MKKNPNDYFKSAQAKNLGFFRVTNKKEGEKLMERKELKDLQSEEIKRQFRKQSEDCQEFAR